MTQELFPIDGRGRTCNAEGREVKLSPAMQSLVRALNAYGHVDPMRDCGRYGFGGNGRTGTVTIVALMDRGILREAKGRWGVHMPATARAQVEAEAYAEHARRAAERAAHAADPERWVQTVDNDGDELHTRMLRTGREIRVVRLGFRFWRVYVPNSMVDMSAGGTAAEARAAADRFERNVAHAKADEVLQADLKAARADNTALPVVPPKTAAVQAPAPFAAGDLVHDRATRNGPREFGTVLLADKGQFKVQWPGSVHWYYADELDPAPRDGMHCRTCGQAITTGVTNQLVHRDQVVTDHSVNSPTVHIFTPCSVCGSSVCFAQRAADPVEAGAAAYARVIEVAADTPSSTSAEIAKAFANYERATEPRSCGRPWVAEIQRCPRCGLGADQHPRTPAEARTGISDRAAAVLGDVDAVRTTFKGLRHPAIESTHDVLAALDRIEAALRAR
jgi:hypothetical protein